MRIGIISDIHIDINKDYDILNGLCDSIKMNCLDMLVIAGDISNNHKVTLDFIDNLSEKSKIDIYFVPGNHDLWDIDEEYNDTRIIYSKLSDHKSCLCGKIVQLNDEWSLIGDIGWYDYTFGEKVFTTEEYKKKEKYGRVWQDSINIKWHESDEEFNNRCLEKLESKLKMLNGNNVISVTHMIADQYFKVPMTREKWDYFNAFLGSEKYGMTYEKYNVKYGIMGHVHYRKKYDKQGVKYICSCLNYNDQWENDNVLEEINKTISIIEI